MPVEPDVFSLRVYFWNVAVATTCSVGVTEELRERAKSVDDKVTVK